MGPVLPIRIESICLKGAHAHERRKRCQLAAGDSPVGKQQVSQDGAVLPGLRVGCAKY